MTGADPHLANVFEDDRGVRRESGFLRRVTKLELVAEADVIPGGYGVCWSDWSGAYAICAPMPWHLVLGAVYAFYHHVRRGLGLPNAREGAAYARGRRDGAAAVGWDRQDAQRQLAAAEHRAFERGWAAAFDRLEKFADEIRQRAAGDMSDG